MAAFAFDTLELADTLREAGVPDKQAKAFVLVVQKSHENTEVATKRDITQLRHEMSVLRKDTDSQYELLRHEIGDLRKDVEILRKDMDVTYKSLRKDMDISYTSLQHQIKELGLQLTIRLGTLVVAVAGILPLVFKFLHFS